MKCYMAKKGELKPGWHVIDVSDKVLGRVAARIATILMGKHRPLYTPHVDTGEFVIVINAAKVKITGEAKFDQRMFEHYTKYPGGRRAIPLREMMRTKPEFVITEAVRRMVPKTKLGKSMMTKLKVYRGAEHPHQAQQPKPLAV